MKARKVVILIVTFLLAGAVLVNLTGPLWAEDSLVEKQAFEKQTLDNVRDYAVTNTTGGPSYAVDGGRLFVGGPAGWTEVETPEGVIVSAVAVDRMIIDSGYPQQLYIGAANGLDIYHSADDGVHWVHTRLSDEFVGSITDIAVDSFQRLIYVGTDTAGLFRLRDVDTHLVVSNQLLLDEPILEVATDSMGAGLAFARTTWSLYRAENFGLRWVVVDNLLSSPTALAIANTDPPAVYVGTVDRGVVKSPDGLTWMLANDGLGMNPGTRLQIDALAIDPMQPNVIYATTSYLFGSTEIHRTPVAVSMSTADGSTWTTLTDDIQVPVVSLMIVPGETGVLYALTDQNRSPVALGKAVEVAKMAETENIVQERPLTDANRVLAWIIAGLATIALMIALSTDLYRRWSPSARTDATLHGGGHMTTI